MITALISRLMILAFGTLYPAYASYKAVRAKDVKEYVKWMMYWIIFALFTCAETFTDVLFSFWFPFYYEIKVAIVLWLLSPATKGSSFLYRHFVHPAFLRRESEIDEMLAKAKERGYSTVMSLGSRGVTYATNVILQTAMKGGGGLVEHIKKSYSLTDLGPKGGDRFIRSDETDLGQDFDPVNEEEEISVRPVLRRRPTGSTGVDMRFKEVDVRQFQQTSGAPVGDIQSTEDISSGYSSTDQLFPGQSELALSRSASVSSRGRGRSTRATQPKRTPLTEETEDIKGGEVYSESLASFPEPFPLPDPDSNESCKISSIIRKFSGCFDEDQSLKTTNNNTDLSDSDVGINIAASLSTSRSSLASTSSDKSERKGRYNKYPAPPPPVNVCQPSTSNVLSVGGDKPSLFLQSLTTKDSHSGMLFSNKNKPTNIDKKILQSDEVQLNQVTQNESPFETTV